MARINHRVEVPQHFNERETERKIVRDLEEISFTLLNIVPIEHRNEISVTYGNGFAVPYDSIGQLNMLYRENNFLSFFYNGPIVGNNEKVRDLDEVEIYQTLLNAEDGDSYNISLRDGRKVSGVPIFNQSKGIFKILDMRSKISTDIPVDKIQDIRLNTNIY
jgi:hypothetical protein